MYFLFTWLFAYFLFTYLFTFIGHTPYYSASEISKKNHVVGLLSVYYLVPFSIYLTSNVGLTFKKSGLGII